jgi:acyl-CoA synthetase (AMP-forming)/AMP-acid ligase II
MLDETAKLQGASPAVVSEDGVLTFEELTRLRDQLAASLIASGIGDGAHVAIFMRKSWEYVVLLHGLWSIGAVVVPLNTMWKHAEVARALVESDAEILVAGRRAAGQDIGAVVDELGLDPSLEVSEPRFPKLRRVIGVEGEDEQSTDPRLDLRAMIQRPTDGRPVRSHRQEGLLLFSSGSTSKPKCVVLRQDGLLGTSHYFFDRLGVSAQDRFISLGPYYHVGGIVQLLGSNRMGATHYLFDGVDIPKIADIAIRDNCTAITGFDTVLTRIFEECESRGADVPFKTLSCSPGTSTHDVFVGMGIRTILNYALSEAGNMVTLSVPEKDNPQGPSNGYPLPGVDVRICNPETGVVLAAGATGEICFRGWNLFRGYYNMNSEQASAPLTDSDGYFHTKDVGWLDEDGRLFYRGRFADMIKTGGENVSASEVEEFLVRTLPSVAVAAVVGIPDGRWGESVVAFVELTDGSVDEHELREACRSQIAGYKIPKRFVQVAPGGWPTSESGKLLKAQLRERLISIEASSAPGV